jgi:hypothetical protein
MHEEFHNVLLACVIAHGRDGNPHYRESSRLLKSESNDELRACERISALQTRAELSALQGDIERRVC